MILLATQVVVAAANFVAFYFVAHGMGPGAVGLVGYALGIVGLFSFVTDLGTGDAASKLIGEGIDTAQRIGAFIRLRVVLAAVLTLLVIGWLVIGPGSGNPSGDRSELSVLVGITLITQLFVLGQATIETILISLRLTGRQVLASYAGLVDVPLRIGVGLRSMGATALATANLVGAAASFGTSVWAMRDQTIQPPVKETYRKFVGFVAPITLSVAFAVISRNLDSVIVGLAKGATEVGLLYGAMRILVYVDLISMSVMKVVYPDLASAAARDDSVEIRHVMKQAYRQIGFVLVPLITGLIVFREEVIHFVLGDAFKGASGVFAIGALSTLVDGLARVSGFTLVATSRQKEYAVGTVLSSVMRTVLGILLIPASLFGIHLAGLGAMGAALAMLASRISLAVIYVRTCSKVAPVGILKPLGGQFAAAGAASAAVILFRMYGVHSTTASAVEMIGAAAAYLALLFAFGGLSRAELRRYRSLLRVGSAARYIRSELRTRPRLDET